MKTTGLILLLMFSATAWADLPSSEPSTNPATQPMAAAAATQAVVSTTQRSAEAPTPTTLPSFSSSFPTPPSRYMSSAYSLVLQRSIFIRGNQTTEVVPINPGNIPVRPDAPPPETDVVFNGVDEADGATAAFFEELSDHRVLLRHEGEAICRGKITHITLDSVDYEAYGKSTHVLLGENLNGQLSASLVSQPVGSLSTGATTEPTTGPASGNESILERMRRRRLMGQ